MVQILDQRGLVPDISPLSQGIGQLIRQRVEAPLIESAQGGDRAALLKLAQRNPSLAQSLLGVERFDEEARDRRRQRNIASAQIYAPIANQALSIATRQGVPAAKAYLGTQLNSGDELIDRAITSTLEMPDDQAFINDLQTDVARFQQLDSTPFQFGSTQTLRDTAGNEYTQTQRRNPQTGTVDSVLTPIGNAPAQPVGELDIVGGTGETPQERAARESAAVQEGARATRRTEAIKAAVRKGEAAFDRISPLKEGIGVYDEAINLVRNEGVATGPLASRLPSIKGNAVKLDNIQKRLGLNVIANTTFGALSDAELDFALSSALPTNLKGEDLVDWLTSKKQSQQKLLAYMEEAAAFLASGENTITDFLELKKARAALKENQTETQDFDLEYDPATGTFR